MPRLSTGCTSAALACLLALSACSERDGTFGSIGSSGSQGSSSPGYAASDCGVQAQSAWVYAAMQDYYLFYDRVETGLDPTRYDAPQQMLEAARYRPLDPYSHLTDAASSNAVFEQGREFGLGFTVRVVDDTVVKIAAVQAQGPLAIAGVERGDTVLGINGRDTLEAFRDGRYVRDTVIGSAEAPGTSVWSIQARDDGVQRDITLTADTYDIRTVVASDVLTRPGYDGAVGYLNFSSFLRTSEAELDAAFAEFVDAGVSELVLDLRYNGGGLISVATTLATRIAGLDKQGETLYAYRYNDKYSSKDFPLSFGRSRQSLGLSRVLILQSESTASASEIVINGLAPYVDVVTVGGRSNGKPYIQTPNDRCGERLFAVEAQGLNINGVNVFGGIEPTCPAVDDLGRDFGVNDDPATGTPLSEGMLEVALGYLDTGTCPTVDAAAMTRRAVRELPFGGEPRVAGAIR